MCQLPKFTCGTNLKLKIIMAAPTETFSGTGSAETKGT
jgi:hypothetical protein